MNKFLQVADRFIYPLIYLLENYNNVSKYAAVLSKGIYSLALMMDSAENHWQIEQMSSHCFTLFLRLKDLIKMISNLSDKNESNYSEVEMREKDVQTKWSSLVMNLAFLISKCKRLDHLSRDQSLEWLGEMIEEAGGLKACVEVCKFAISVVIKQ